MLVRSTKMRHLCFVQLALVREKSSWPGKSCVAFGLSLEARETVSFCDKFSPNWKLAILWIWPAGTSFPPLAPYPHKEKKRKINVLLDWHFTSFPVFWEVCEVYVCLTFLEASTKDIHNIIPMQQQNSMLGFTLTRDEEVSIFCTSMWKILVWRTFWNIFS